MDPLLRSRGSLHGNVFNVPHRNNVKIWLYVHYNRLGDGFYKPGNLENFVVISCICYHRAERQRGCARTCSFLAVH